MLELRQTNEISRGEVVLLVNDEDSSVITEFFNQAKKNKIMQFITISDINKIVKNAERIQKNKLEIHIEQSDIAPPTELAKSVTATIGHKIKT